MARILLLGASGLLGRSLSTAMIENHQVIKQSRRNGVWVDVVADPANLREVQEVVERTAPDVIINSVAMTQVDQCQQDSQSAYNANARVVESITTTINGTTTRLIHISTDHLYTRPFPQAEDQIDVVNMYAATKLLGELFALRHPHTLVLRTNFAGSSGTESRRSFSDWIVDSLRSGTRIRLAHDLLFNPLSLDTLSHYVTRLVSSPAVGLYNLGSIGSTSKYATGTAIASHLGLNTKLIECVAASELRFATPRPTDMTMDVSRFQRDCFSLPNTSAEIEKIARSHEHTR